MKKLSIEADYIPFPLLFYIYVFSMPCTFYPALDGLLTKQNIRIYTKHQNLKHNSDFKSAKRPGF